MPEGKEVIWNSSGLRLLTVTDAGCLTLTEDFMRAYYTRPEIHPIEESCAAEHRLFETLMEQPFRTIAAHELQAIADTDTAENYRVVLAFRDHLRAHETLEAAYLALFESGPLAIAPVMIDQLVHVFMAHMLRDIGNPFRARAGELFFREQKATTGDGRLILADAELLEMHASRPAGTDGLAGLLAEAEGLGRDVTLDVMTVANAEDYWPRADRFDMAIDFRFTQPACDAFARNLESWIGHFLGVETRIQPLRSIRDEHWSWHVGLDAEATRLLNDLYTGADLDPATLEAIIALFRLDWLNPSDTVPALADKPVYLALAKRQDGSVRMKPQNLLMSLPLNRS